MRPLTLAIVVSGAALCAACSKSPEAVPTAVAAAPVTVAARAEETHDEGIAWTYAANEAEVDAAFANARAQNKPVFVYWGAKWCPPCNQVKATLFNRQDFIARSRAFVPVYIDGDSPGAQKLGSRFKVSGYPTMVLFNPQGAEITRLPGEVEGARYTQLLSLSMSGQRPAKEVLVQALGDPKALAANDWRLLAFYTWDTNEQQLVPKQRVPALLKQLADTCPPEPVEIATRLRLMALAAVDAKASAHPDPTAQAALLALLDTPAASRVHLDLLTNQAPDIVRALSARRSPQRAALLGAFDTALKRFEADTSLSRADRMQALIAQVDLARIDVTKNNSQKPAQASVLPAPLLADIRTQVAQADQQITDGFERQAVITSAAYLLDEAGLGAESDALLQANLAKSHSPYYLMSELAGNAKRRGDKPGALRWYREAFETSEGPATRLQWGASYVNALIELAPQEEAPIEKTASRLLDEASRLPDAFYERSGRSLTRVGTRLQEWNRRGAHAQAIERLRKQLTGICAALQDDAPRARCEQVLSKPGAKASA